MRIKEAIEKFKQGEFLLVYDSDFRERETDLVISAEFVEPIHVRFMRKYGGGLICLAISRDIADTIGLKYMVDIYEKTCDPLLKELIPKDLPYDEKSSFSISINYRGTFTGISDIDRAMTIKNFALMCKKNPSRMAFVKNFRSPGHVPILIASKNLVLDRMGHTELSITLARLSNLVEVVTVCEMIGNDFKSLSKEEAKKFAKDHNLIFIEGKEILNAFKRVVTFQKSNYEFKKKV